MVLIIGLLRILGDPAGEKAAISESPEAKEPVGLIRFLFGLRFSEFRVELNLFV